MNSPNMSSPEKANHIGCRLVAARDLGDGIVGNDSSWAWVSFGVMKMFQGQTWNMLFV